jgi:hypothetical protein
MPLGNALGLRWKLNFCLNRPPDTLSQADRRMVNAAEYMAWRRISVRSMGSLSD